MRKICPHTTVALETVEALQQLDVEYVDVSGSDTAYFDLLAELWAASEDFCVIEQDIIVRPDTIASFKRCDSEWCAAPYPYLGSSTYAGLGCVRFRSSLLQALPNLFRVVARHDYEGHGPKHWCTLDAAIQRELWARGRHACTRHEPVGHLHTSPTHGCVAA